MTPNKCCSGLAFVILLLTGCNTESPITEEKSDPVLVEYPVVYIERSTNIAIEGEPTQLANFSAQNPTAFNPGAKLIYKKNAFAESEITDLSPQLSNENVSDGQAIDIRDLSVSADGQQFLVSIRAPNIADVSNNEQPKWNIWRYQQSSQRLERIITDDFVAEQGDDLMASFLPDGRIIFASNRQRLSRAILLDEGKPQYSGVNEKGSDSAFNIHIMTADGSSITQVTYNLSHDFYPLVLQNGSILYSRWDAMGGNNKINLYRMLPDGTENQLVYGWHSHQLPTDENVVNIEFIKPQQLPNGDILLLLANTDGQVYQKRPTVININNFTDQNQQIGSNNQSDNAYSDLFSNGQFNYNFTEKLNPAGRINHVFSLPDNSQRYLLSLDLCRVIIDEQLRACGQVTAEQLMEDSTIQAPSLYELWLFNQNDNTQQLVASTKEGKILTEAIIMQPSDITAEFIADKVIGNELDVDLFNQQSGAIHIRSVYDFDGEDSTEFGINQLKDPLLTSAEQRPARFIRIVRGVPMPSREVRQTQRTDFGRSANQLMREIVGYSVVQPDGSVKIKVPANVPLAISILDKQGKRIGGRHQQWITVKAGETLECFGCHTSSSQLPHGRIEAQAPSINFGATETGVAFPNTTTTILPEFGQTMAQALEIAVGLPELLSDLVYQDVWSNSNVSLLNEAINLSYQLLGTSEPTGSQCFKNWNAFCRIQINYEEHIQPLWEKSRQIINEPTGELLNDNTCITCHSPIDLDGLAQVPAGQLNLLGEQSIDEPAHLTSYRELLFNDVEQEVIDGVLVDKLVELLDDDGNIVFEVDINGQLILDENGIPIPILTTVNVNRILSTNGAHASQEFFDKMNNTQHQDILTPSELRLLSEWLDIGAQYYNTPFYQQD